MESRGIRQTKTELSAIVRAAAAGECSLVTDNGKLVAMIGPPPLDEVQAEAPAGPAEATPLTDAAVFREALLGAPYPLELDF